MTRAPRRPPALITRTVAVTFGTAALLFPVLIAAAIGVGAAGVTILRRAGAAEEAGGRRSDPRTAAAPAPGEGSGSPHSSPGPAG